jgi:hypothetical protein
MEAVIDLTEGVEFSMERDLARSHKRYIETEDTNAVDLTEDQSDDEVEVVSANEPPQKRIKKYSIGNNCSHTNTTENWSETANKGKISSILNYEKEEVVQEKRATPYRRMPNKVIGVIFLSLI